MDLQRALRRTLGTINKTAPPLAKRSYICASCLRRSITTSSTAAARTRPKPCSLLRDKRLQPFRQSRQQSNQPADSPAFTSIVDNPPTLIRSGNKHKPLGLALLASIPLIAFALGCWQVQRLGWKTALTARFEDRLVREPLPLPPVIDPDAVKDFDYRRVKVKGRWAHEKECLIGPRVHDGQDGFLVVTPLERGEEFPGFKGNTTVLVCRGWIPKSKAAKSSRPASLSDETVEISGLLREPWKKNMFTPNNKPEESKWYFPDVAQIASHTGSQPIWIEETMQPDLLVSYDREAKGVPIGRPPEVNLRNNHFQYIFTWFSLSAATSVMLWMVLKKPVSGIRGRVRQNKEW